MRRFVGPTAGILALALTASAGTAVGAGLITGKDVKNQSLTGKDVKNKSLTRADFRGSIRGPAGPAGPPGPPGPAGATGLERVEAHVDYGADTPFTGQAVAQCPAGKRAIGGGGKTDGSDEAGAITESYPTADLTAWVVSAIRVTGSPPWRVTAYAVCVAA
jgi:hypothetical protein